MHNRLLIFSLIILCFTATNCVSTTNSEDIRLGEKLYKENCAECHGEGAQGQDPQNQNGGFNAQGERLAPALNGTAHSWHHSPELLLRYIQKGSVDETSPMPSFKGTLSIKESLAIITYFQSLWPQDIIQNYEKRFKR